jgi:hypothetical protein
MKTPTPDLFMNPASSLATPWRAAGLLFLLCLAFLAAPRPAWAQATATPPNLMTYQGYLVDGNGNALATNAPANYVVRFRIFNAGTGGTKLWGEEQTVTVDKGYFSVVLGEGTAEPDNLRPPLGSVFASNTASDRFIETTVVIGVTANTLAPRLRLMPSPYSFMATSAGQLVNAQGATYVSSPSPGTVTVAGVLSGNGSGLTSLAPASIAGTLAANQIPSLDAAKITTGVLGLARIPALDAARIPSLDATKISGGVLDAARIPSLDAAKIGSGVLALVRIPNLDASKITVGIFDAARVPATLTGNRIFSGNVGIGTTTPGFPLNFPNSLGDKISLYGQSGNSFGFGIAPSTLQIHTDHSGSDIAFGHGSSASMTETMRIKGSGNVGIGTTAPVRKLHVNGDMRVEGWIYQTFGGVEYRLDRNAFDGIARWNSDARLKERITTIPAALHTLAKLRGVTWQWNETGLECFTKDLQLDYRSASGRPEDDEKIWEEKRREILQEHSKVQFGFLAQEVEQVFPDWVSTGNDGYKQINMERLSAVLVNAINEQQQQIEALRTAQAAQLATLQARNERLERQVAELTARQAGREQTLEARTAALERLVGKLTQAQAAAAPAAPALLLEELTAPATVVLHP